MVFPVVNGLRGIEFGTKGTFRDALNDLVLSGTKRATAGLLESDYQAENEPVETIGERLAVLNNEGIQIATIQVTDVSVTKFSEVPNSFAIAEGEGDLSSEDFKASHLKYWTKNGANISDETLVVLVYFNLIEDLRGSL